MNSEQLAHDMAVKYAISQAAARLALDLRRTEVPGGYTLAWVASANAWARKPGLRYQSWTDTFHAGDGVTVPQDQVIAFLRAYSATPDARPEALRHTVSTAA